MPTTGSIGVILAAPSLWCGLAARSTVRAPRKVGRHELMIGVGAGGQRGVGQPRRHAANVPPGIIILAPQHTRARVDRASTVHADESSAWNTLHARFDTRRINHSVEYATDEACTNQAE